MPVKRSEELHNLCERLRKESPAFKGSIADYWEKQNYMNDENVINELKRMVSNWRRINKFMETSKDKCGELTREEKKALKILTENGY